MDAENGQGCCGEGHHEVDDALQDTAVKRIERIYAENVDVYVRQECGYKAEHGCSQTDPVAPLDERYAHYRLRVKSLPELLRELGFRLLTVRLLLTVGLLRNASYRLLTEGLVHIGHTLLTLKGLLTIRLLLTVRLLRLLTVLLLRLLTVLLLRLLTIRLLLIYGSKLSQKPHTAALSGS